MLPKTMTVIEATEAGGPEVLVPASGPCPQPGAGEVLIEVAAAGINRPDVLQRQGLYPPPKGASDLLGLEVAGKVAALGPGADALQTGDRVCALVNGGGYAEYAVAPEATTLPRPAGPHLRSKPPPCPRPSSPSGTMCSSAAQLKPGEWLLVHGGASGIGTTAIQIATALGAQGHRHGRQRREGAACEALGAVRAINYREEDFVEAVRETTGGHGADVILDMVGGDYIERNLRAAALEGRIVQIAFLKGSKVEIDLMRLMMRRLTLTGSTLRAQTPRPRRAWPRRSRSCVWPLIAEGQAQARDRFDLQARGRGRRPSPHRRPGAYRQDRAGGEFLSEHPAGIG